MINKDKVISLFLEACPDALDKWKEHLEWWDGEEAGLYNDISIFAHYIVDSFSEGKTEMFPAVFKLVEGLIVDGDEETRNLAVVGFLEGLQNIASWREFGNKVFLQWLGSNSRLAWLELEEIWAGKNSLADVIRAERQQK